MIDKSLHWQVSKELAEKYSIPLDRQLYCDKPLITILGNLSGKFVLDVGCGNGGLTREIAKEAGRVIGIDTSSEMLKQAQGFNQEMTNLEFLQADAQNMPFKNEEFDVVVCSMTINTFSSEETVGNFFQEAARVLKQTGKLVIALPNPSALDTKTKFRWTEWKESQTQLSLVPGEAINRKIMGKNGEILTVINYYWSSDFLIDIAGKYSLSHIKNLQPIASEQEFQQYPALDPILKTTPFFLIMVFGKK